MKSPARYPNLYVWLVFVSTLDVLLTYVVLRFGGAEANPVALAILQRFGLPGMVAFKMAIVCLAVAIAEVIGRRDAALGRRFVCYAIAISATPVGLAFALLWRHG